jgi:hypothetical protein
MVIRIEQSHIIQLLAGLAILFTLAGWSYSKHEREAAAADAIRDWHEVNVLEARLNRFNQVIAMYDIKPIPVEGEGHD